MNRYNILGDFMAKIKIEWAYWWAAPGEDLAEYGLFAEDTVGRTWVHKRLSPDAYFRDGDTKAVWQAREAYVGKVNSYGYICPEYWERISKSQVAIWETKLKLMDEEEKVKEAKLEQELEEKLFPDEYSRPVIYAGNGHLFDSDPEERSSNYFRDSSTLSYETYCDNIAFEDWIEENR